MEIQPRLGETENQTVEFLLISNEDRFANEDEDKEGHEVNLLWMKIGLKWRWEFWK